MSVQRYQLLNKTLQPTCRGKSTVRPRNVTWAKRSSRTKKTKHTRETEVFEKIGEIMVNPKTSYWIHQSECLGLMVWKGCLNQPFWGWGHLRLLRENVTHMSWKHVRQRRTNYGRGSCSVSLFQADSMAGSKVTMYEVFIGHPCKGLLPPKKETNWIALSKANKGAA